MKPLEVAPIFLHPRVRLRYRVPLFETLELISTGKDDEKGYPAIEHSVESLVESSSRVFTQDIFDLSILRLGLEAREYSITNRGKYALGRRLDITYADGVEFRSVSVYLGAMKIEPIVRLRPKLTKSEELALKAATLSKRIGVEIDFELDTGDNS